MLSRRLTPWFSLLTPSNPQNKRWLDIKRPPIVRIGGLFIVTLLGGVVVKITLDIDDGCSLVSGAGG